MRIPYITSHNEAHARYILDQFLRGQFCLGIPGLRFVSVAQRVGRRIREAKDRALEGSEQSGKQSERAATKGHGRRIE